MKNILSIGIICVMASFSNIAFGAPSIDPNCFKESSRFQVHSGKDAKLQITGDKGEIFFVQDSELLPYKTINNEKPKYIEYTVISNSSGNKEDLKKINDGNSATVFVFDNLLDSKKSITLDFGKMLEENSFDYQFIFHHPGTASFSIGKSLDLLKSVKEENIRAFSFRYLKIDFDTYSQDSGSVKTEVAEINFFTPGPSTYVIKPNKIGSIESFRAYDCEGEKMRDTIQTYSKLNQKLPFSIDAGSEEIKISFQKNPKYNNDFDADGALNDMDNCKYVANKDQLDSDRDGIGDICDLDRDAKTPNDYDTDKDSIPDSGDNCKYLYNPNQKDSNADGQGDICSDDDRDGIIGKNDNCPTVSNPDQKDINVNGVGDACEFDKDADRIFDSIDNCMTTVNPDQKDSDYDGIGDSCDNCKLYNPDQRDINHDGIGDTCEEAEKYAKENDTDKDSILDFQDNCPRVANKDQSDSDLDGIGDACDNCSGLQNADQKDDNKNGKGDMCEDIDNDGIDGFKDNCPTIANADQKDGNNSGLGDVCKDDDNDGFVANEDNCPYVYNPDQNDVDKDKIGDVCDQKDDRYMESNKTFFGIMLVLLISFFAGGIYVMISKLRGK